MDSRQFDRFTKFMTRGTNRRHAMKSIAAGALGGGLASLAGAAAAANAPGEEWVQLYESMAAAVDKLDADCATVVQALQDWQTKNATRIAQMQQDIQTWTTEQRAAHRAAHSQRVQNAAISIQLALTRCGYKPDSISPFTEADINSVSGMATPTASSVGVQTLFYTYHTYQATPSAQGAQDAQAAQAALDNCPNDPPGYDAYCNCECEPNSGFTVGNCILFGLACAFGGCASPPNCCWSGICVAGFDYDHCVMQCHNCVNIQPSGSGCG